jgi:hypothetical protein
MILDFISFFVFAFSFTFIAFKLFITNHKLNNIKSDLIQCNIDKNIIVEKINNDTNKSFLNFVEQSRQDAFKYIEEVQVGLNKFISDIEPEIKYFKEYSDLTSMGPNYYSMKKIADSYDQLKQLLPKED